MERLTVGYRCRIKPEGPWGLKDGYAGHEVILTERSRKEFSVLVLKKGKDIPLNRVDGIVVNCIAWLDEDELEFVDKNIDTNIRFIDWYAEIEEYECPDCGHLCHEEYMADLDRDDDFECPKCDCVFL